jgi:phage shock protein C
MSRRDVKLYRDTNDKKVGGVCSGLARYFEIDPLLVRVAFVAAMVFGGGSLVAYVLLWWLVDPAPDGYWTDLTDTETAVEAFPPPTASDDTAPGRHAA